MRSDELYQLPRLLCRPMSFNNPAMVNADTEQFHGFNELSIICHRHSSIFLCNFSCFISIIYLSLNMRKLQIIFILFLCAQFSFAQPWACYPLSQPSAVTCGWACFAGHLGQDWQYTPNNSSYGQNVYSVDSGTVVFVETGHIGCDDPNIPGGNDWAQPSNKIIIQHTNGFYTRYLNIKDVIPGIIVGSVVSRGEVIAYVGNVGPITPCDNNDNNINAHLHFEVGIGYTGNSLTGKFDPSSIFDGCSPPYCCSSSTIINNNCRGLFYDSGGPNANYANYENLIYTISPPSATNVTANFYWIDIEAGYDFINFYDGPNTASPSLGTFTGTNNPGVIASTGPSLTIQFTSDYSIIGPGWDADWFCNFGSTSINNQSLSNSIVVFPNPSTGDFTIKNSRENENAEIEISNALGEIVFNAKMTNGTFQVHLENVSAGVYFLKVKTTSGIVIKKISVKG